MKYMNLNNSLNERKESEKELISFQLELKT